MLNGEPAYLHCALQSPLRRLRKGADRRVDRQHNVEGTALAEPAGTCPNRSTMLFHDASADEEAQTHPGKVSIVHVAAPMKAVKETGKVGLWNADPLIGDGDVRGCILLPDS